MSQTSTGKIKCASCGRQYPWKDELAGRKIKCKCGQVFQAPASAPVEEEDALYDLAPDLAPVAKPSAVQPVPRPATVAQQAGVATSVPKAKPAAVLPYVSKRANDGPDKSAELKKLIIPAVAIVLLIGLVVGARLLFHAVKANQPPALGQDGKVAELDSEYGKTEALEWFKQSMHQSILGSIWTREQAQQRIEGWYSQGAKKVYAFGGVMTNSLAIELPDDPVKRKFFVDLAERWRMEHHFDRPPIKDVGQKFVMIDFW